MNRGVIEAAAEAGAKLVFADNLYMYPPGSSPMTEDTPPLSTTHKGRLRPPWPTNCWPLHRDGRVRVAIGRSSDYFGPGGVDSVVGARFFKAVVAGKKTQWFADLDQPHTLSYLPDMARALVVLGTRPEADGRVWHLPAAEAFTGRQVIAAAGRAAGTAPAPAAARAGRGPGRRAVRAGPARVPGALVPVGPAVRAGQLALRGRLRAVRGDADGSRRSARRWRGSGGARDRCSTRDPCSRVGPAGHGRAWGARASFRRVGL